MRGKQSQKSSKACPDGWLELVMEGVDFERAFAALEGFNHFHSETLRGKMRSLQLRTGEAAEHFRRAEKRARRSPNDLRKPIRLFYLRFYALTNALIEEARSDDSEVRIETELEMQRFLECEDPDSLSTDQIRILMIGHYQLLRGNYDSALEAFECLIEESRSRIEDFQLDFFCGAQAAALALGDAAKAERHYENAQNLSQCISQPFKLALAASKLHVLLKYSGRDAEAQGWLDLLERMPIPPASRRHFLELAEIYLHASTVRNRIVI
jgi:tetratricopeptide (TPR) repeat protein